VSGAGGTVLDQGAGQLAVTGLGPERIGDLAFDAGVRLHELAVTQASLEQAFMELTGSSVEFRASAPGEPGQAGPEQELSGSGVAS
jgi:ABC-2 type transport system ATP-binding protein